MINFAATTTADGYPCHYFGTRLSTCGTTLHCVGVFTPFGLFERNYDEQGRRLSWDHIKLRYYVDEQRQESVGPATNEGGAIMGDWKERIKQWAADRNLIEGSTPWKQVRKLIEETEELATALHENDIANTKDAIGDIQVVLCVMCAQLGIDIDECREIAYEQIKDRKGRMVDGVFVKEVSK